MHISIYKIAAALLLLGFTACDRNFEATQTDNFALEGRSYIKVVNNALNTRRNVLFVDSRKISGNDVSYNSGTLSASLFPVRSDAYAAIPSGFREIVLRDTTAGSIQAVYQQVTNLKPNTYYTLFLRDSLNNTKYNLVEETGFAVTDDSLLTRLRFTNMMYNSSATPMPNMDVISRNYGPLFRNVPPQTLSSFIWIPANRFDSIFIRAAGTNTNLATVATTFLPNRNTTIMYRGSWRVTSAWSATNFYGRHTQTISTEFLK